MESKDSELISKYLNNFKYNAFRTKIILKKYEGLIKKEQHVNKVRAIIIDDGKILVCKYSDVFMLPGGKKENESDIEALKRELAEELGIIIDDNCNCLCEYNQIYPNYYDTKTKSIVERHNSTKYYLVEKNNIIGYTERDLTDSEIKNNFEAFYLGLDDLKDMLTCYSSSNEKYDFFKDELLHVLNILSSSSKLILK